MKDPLRILGGWLARYLNHPRHSYEPYVTISSEQIQRVLQPADVLPHGFRYA